MKYRRNTTHNNLLSFSPAKGGRVLFLIATFLFLLLTMILAKPVFMMYNHAGHDISLTDVAQVIFHGFSLDLTTTLYFILVPYLVVLVSLWTKRWDVLRIILKVYYALASVVIALAFTVDTSLYAFWRIKLDASVLQFIDGTGGAVMSVSVGYLLLRVAVIVFLALLIYVILVWLTPRQHNDRRSVRAVWQSHTSSQGGLQPVRTWQGRVFGTLLMILLLPVIFLGIRGGVGVSTTNVGQVYFSNNQFLNHSAVNPIFSFVSSVGKTSADIPQYDYFSEAELKKELKGFFFTSSNNTDTLLTTQRPNIVFIIMEGCGAEFTDVSGRSDITPNINRIARESIHFTQCYANSWRTDRGVCAILSGWPAFPTISVMKMPSKINNLPGIAASLKPLGYQSTFVYGGDANFTNTRGYLVATGFDHIVSENEFTHEQRGTSKWGVCDSIAFDRLYELVTRQDKGKPTLTALLTLSSHEPWTVPMPTKFDDEVLNSFYYLDRELGRFVERFKKSEQWNNTLVIILPDHGIYHGNVSESTQIMSHIPMLWTGGAISYPQQIGLLCCQSDIAAMLLGQMGVTHDDYPFSRDILSSDYQRPLAFHNWPTGFSVTDTLGFHAYDLNSNRILTGKNGAAIRTGKAILQATSADLKKR